MALITVNFRSTVLSQETAVNIVLPEGCAEEDIPTVYLLHGMHGDHTSWCRKSNIERYAAERRLAIVMPDGENGFYTDMKYGKKHYTFVSEELVNYTRKVFRLSRRRERTFVAGLSMGGYGAFRLALTKPEQYSAAASLSGCLDIIARLDDCPWKNEATAIWGEDFASSARGTDSDLMYLLDRLYELPEDGSGGRITIGGTDIKDIKAAYLRKNIGIVLQEPYLFSRTIAENIGVCGADEAAIREAAKTACIADDIEGFANGYETMVGERGVTLSGGQKQRVAIARMLTQKTPVTVFDDSLSAVDTQTDEKIRAALARERKGATSIIISHRITTLLDCDNILVLDHGKVLQLGTPAELLREEGLFRQIYDMQMAIGEEAET